MEHYDVIVIGSGAGGGTLTHRLASSGKRVLLLERGDWLPREPQNWLAEDVFEAGRYMSQDSWLDDHGKPFQPQVHYYVGGATKLYGAALYRLRAQDFGELRHYDGISPAWPISYEQMEPYYTQAEQLYQVRGARGEDPTEPAASAPYPHPAVSHEPRIAQLAEDLAATGHHPFHAPCGVLLDESNMPYSKCLRCPDCDGFPCLVHAKSDAEVIAVRPAIEHDNVTLLRNARAVRLNPDDAGTSIREVLVERDGEQEIYGADIVVVSAGAANSAALLLNSACERHPRGLANGSDQVGRNYMFHNSVAVLALSKEPNPTVFQKTLGVNDYYLRGPDFEFPLGNIQMVGKSQAPMFRGEKPHETLLAPNWTLRDIAHHAVDFWLSTEDLPMMDNRVTVTADGQVQLSYNATNEEPRKRLYHTLTSMLGKLGMEERHLLHNAYLQNPIPVAGVAHQAGTCRFGADPASSVLDVDCRAHELDNLYVVDTSFFPSIGAVNPALTAMANALRVGEHLLERLGVSSNASTDGG
jgi:choline dehydrogenase-like flavoprotein